MCSVCADQQHHKFHHSPQLYLTKKSLREIDIPPRKLLNRGRSPAAAASEMFDFPKAEDDVFSKFLPYNNVDDDGSDPYSSDHFRMYEFKVRKCTRSRSHDWTDCPFAHPGEKARRRDPRRFHYSGTVCSEFRKGHCNKGDNCEFSHGVFECWLHPSRYRTEACKDGKNCKRKVCFFAHSSRQLRILPEEASSPPPANSPMAAEKYHHGGGGRNLNHCCVFCHSVLASPNSTLMGMAISSPPLSPPISPMNSPDYSRFLTGMSYKDKLTELMASLEAMNVTDQADHHHHEAASNFLSSPAPICNTSRGLPWLDVNFGVEDQPQFVMSPSSSSTPGSGPSKFSSGGSNSSRFYRSEFSGRNLMMEENNRFVNNTENSQAGPDIEWVNDLLT